MGSRISCVHRGSLSGEEHQPAPARVVAVDGSLKELPVSPSSRVSDVLCLLGGDAEAAGTPLLFVCSSDALYFNEHPPALAPGDLLQPGQIYFVLPAAMLDRALSTADMAALAVRASAALASSSRSEPRRGRKVRVLAPLREKVWGNRGGGEDDAFLNEKLNEQTLGVFGVLLTPATGDEKLAAAAAAAERARMKRALSIVREDAA